MVRELVIVSAMIGGVAIAAPMIFTTVIEPGVSPQGSQSHAAVARTGQMSGHSRGGSGGAAFEVVIKAAGNGHFYIDAGINRASTRVMVDTGASIVALRESDARAAGIRPHRDDYSVPLSTANGTSYGAAATIESIVVDHIEVRDVEALVIPDEQLSISLLGTSFLRRLSRFQVSGDILIIEN